MSSDTHTRVGVLDDAEVDPAATRRARLDLERREPLAERRHQPVGGERLLVDRCAAAREPRLDEVAVVVPLHGVDRVLADDRRHPFEHVVEGLGDRQVEHLLVAGTRGQPTVGLQDPLRVGAGEVAVLVHHLGFEPQAELHAERADPVDQRAESVRPDVLVDVPVAEAGVVVAAAAEPAVVEHVAFDAEGRGTLGEVDEAGQVVVEVHGLPHVDRHRAGRRRVLRAAAEPAVEPSGLVVEAVPVREVHPRPLVRGAGVEPDLAGQQQFAAADDLAAGGEPFGVVPVVAAPGGVDAPDLTVGEAEARARPPQDGRGVGAGAALPALALWVPTTSSRRCGVRSLPQRPAKSRISRAPDGIGIASVRSSTV